MIKMEEKIKTALQKAESYLIEQQNKEGYWSAAPEAELKGPEHLRKPISITPQIIDGLIHLETKNVSAVNKAIFYCYNEKVEDTDEIDLLAYQLKALSYSNAAFIEKKANTILNIILKRQHKEGYWPSFPKTSNLTNFIVAEGLSDYKSEESLNKLKEWLKENKSKDMAGWGLNNESEKAQVSFTANAILTLLLCKEDFSDKEVIKFIEKKQMKDGGWPSSDFTYQQDSTTYATALVCLILLKTNPETNNAMLKAGIKYLLESQLEDGSWPLKKEFGPGEYFTTVYAMKTLKYYAYIKSRLEDKHIRDLLKTAQNKQIVNDYLLAEYEKQVRNRFLDINYGMIMDKILATTTSAVKRRKLILSIMEKEGSKDTAAIIDALKNLEGYRGLHKRSHLAQIKNDMDALVNLNFIEENGRNYFLVRKIE